MTPVLSVPPQQTWDAGLDDSGQNDQMQLPSVPWIDILDATIIDSTCHSTRELDFGVVSNGAAQTDDCDAAGASSIPTMITTTSQTATAATHAFFSAPEDFEFSPAFDMSVDQNISGSEKEGTSSRENMQHQHQHDSTGGGSLLRRVSSLSSSLATGGRSQTSSFEFMSHNPASSHSSTWTRSNRATAKPPDDRSSTSMADRKDACIQELASLSSSLMKDLHRVVGCKLASSFLFTRSDKGPVEYLFRTLDGSMSEESAIGRMLQGSEKFLEIMQLFNEPAQYSPPLDNSLRNDLDFNFLYQAMDSPESDSEGQPERRWSILQSYIEHQNATPNALPFASWLGNSLALGHAQKPDITFKLAVLTCYTCLLRIYETVFFVIHHTLECSPSLTPAIKLPQTVPGLEINGFMLQNHPTLQIRILIQVSTYMLDSVERALNGMLTDPTFQILLKTVLQQEGLQCSLGNETGELFYA